MQQNKKIFRLIYLVKSFIYFSKMELHACMCSVAIPIHAVKKNKFDVLL